MKRLGIVCLARQKEKMGMDYDFSYKYGKIDEV